MAAPVHTLDGISLPADIVWKDEFDWAAAVSSLKYSVTGAAIVQTRIRQAGRPLTLESAANDQGCVSRATVAALRALADTGRTNIVFTHADGRAFRVMFAPDAPISSQPIAWRAMQPESWLHAISLKLLILEELVTTP